MKRAKRDEQAVAEEALRGLRKAFQAAGKRCAPLIRRLNRERVVVGRDQLLEFFGAVEWYLAAAMEECEASYAADCSKLFGAAGK